MQSWLEISAAALRHNLGLFRTHIGRDGTSRRILAVVKANAYGHGLCEVAHILAQAEAGDLWLGVNSLSEAQTLRSAGIELPILIMGMVAAREFDALLATGARLVAYNAESVAALAARAASLGIQARVHLKIETGTGRQGIMPHDLPAFAHLLHSLPALEVEGVYTHFANIEDTTDPSYAAGQLRSFGHALALLAAQGIHPPVRHAACSAAAILFPETYFDMVRIGISLYGLWPSKETYISALGRGASLNAESTEQRLLPLRPALTWKAPIAQLKDLPAGHPVGYGLTYITTHRTRIAVLPVGYADGYDRRFSNLGVALVRGQRCPVLGRVMMNMCVLDVSHVAGVSLEDEVVLLGSQQDAGHSASVSAEELASIAGTIPYEILARINPSLPRNVL